MSYVYYRWISEEPQAKIIGMEYVIQDNFLNQDEFDHVRETVMCKDVPWYYTDGITDAQDGQCQFCHTLYGIPNMGSSMGGPISEASGVLEMFIRKLNISSILRAKLNLTTKATQSQESGLHIDIKDGGDWTTSIYYLNTNNGYTFFENGTKVESVENRLLSFPSTWMHAGATCTDALRRVVLNLNYYQFK